jgi:hypothetical protein
MEKTFPVFQSTTFTRDGRPVTTTTRVTSTTRRLAILFVIFTFGVLSLFLSSLILHGVPRHGGGGSRHVRVPLHAEASLSKCRALNIKPGPPPDFNERKVSDRFESGTKATLIRNATIWTGKNDGLEIIKGDLFLDHGLVKAIGVIPKGMLKEYKDLNTIEAEGAWVTPGCGTKYHLATDTIY